MNPMLVAGGALGALWLLDQQGTVRHESAGAAVTAVVDALLAHKTIAGVDVRMAINTQTASQRGANASFTGIRLALVDKLGGFDASGWANTPLPATMTRAQLIELCDVWIDAWRKGYGADDRVFSLMAEGDSLPRFSELILGQALNGSATDDWDLSPLGLAVTSLAWIRYWVQREGDPSMVDLPDTIEVFDRVVKVAGEMDGADYTIPGVRPGDGEFEWSNVPGAVAYAVEESVEFVADTAGSALGAVGRSVASSSLFWAGVLGFVAWRVLR